MYLADVNISGRSHFSGSSCNTSCMSHYISSRRDVCGRFYNSFV